MVEQALGHGQAGTGGHHPLVPLDGAGLDAGNHSFRPDRVPDQVPDGVGRAGQAHLVTDAAPGRGHRRARGVVAGGRGDEGWVRVGSMAGSTLVRPADPRSARSRFAGVTGPGMGRG